MRRLKNLEKEKRSKNIQEVVIKFIEKIKEKEKLDLSFFVNDDGLVVFGDAKNKMNQIIKILTYKNNKIKDVYFGYQNLDLENLKLLFEALKNENNNITSIDLRGNNLGVEGAKLLSETLKEKK